MAMHNTVTDGKVNYASEHVYLSNGYKHGEVSVNSNRRVLFTVMQHVNNKRKKYLNILLENGKNRQESVSPSA
jgi:hypothetical protein